MAAAEYQRGYSDIGYPPPTQSTLDQFSFHGGNEAKRLRDIQATSEETAIKELKTNLSALTHEVLIDHPVSTPYPVYFGLEYPDYFKVYSDEKRTAEYDLDPQFDPGERGGVVKTAFYESTKMAKLNPGKVVVSLSLAGKAGMDNDPNNAFKKIDYNTIQFYHMFYDIAKDKIFASAITASNEELTTEMLQNFGIEPPTPGYVDPYIQQLQSTGNLNDRFNDEDTKQASKVLYYLRQPVMTGLDIHTYMEELDKRYGSKVLHKNKSGKEYTVAAVLHDLNEKLSDSYEGIVKHEAIVEQVIAKLTAEKGTVWTEELVNNAYFLVMKRYAEANGIDSLKLAGSCGGETITINKLNAMLGMASAETTLIDPETVFHPMSSAARLLREDPIAALGIDLAGSCEKRGCNHSEKHFHCPDKSEGGCGSPIPSGKGYEHCPRCGLTKDDYAKQTGVSCD